MGSRLQSNVDVHNIQTEHGHVLAFSLGVIRVASDSNSTMEELLSHADEAMHAHKQQRKA